MYFTFIQNKDSLPATEENWSKFNQIHVFINVLIIFKCACPGNEYS